MKRNVTSIIMISAWISAVEFLRNQIILSSHWKNHYLDMGLEFPSKPINGAVWGLWAIIFSILIYVITKKFTPMQTFALCWTLGFVLMWLVIGNLGVLPYKILLLAVPMSMIEVAVAILIIKRTNK